MGAITGGAAIGRAGNVITRTPAGRRRRPGIPWREICELLQAIEAEQTLQGVFQRTLEQLEILVPYDFGLAVLSNSARPDRLPLVISRSAPRELIDRYFRSCILVDPWRSAVSAPIRSRPRWTPSQHSEFVHEFILPDGAGRSISVSNLKEPGPHGFAVSLHRGDGGSFSVLEQGILEAIFPHLNNFFHVLTDRLDEHARRLLDAAAGAGLSRREKEIYLLLCERLTFAEIAQRLFISRHTAAKHIEHIYDKLLVSGRRGACQPGDQGREQHAVSTLDTLTV